MGSRSRELEEALKLRREKQALVRIKDSMGDIWRGPYAPEKPKSDSITPIIRSFWNGTQEPFSTLSEGANEEALDRWVEEETKKIGLGYSFLVATDLANFPWIACVTGHDSGWMKNIRASVESSWIFTPPDCSLVVAINEGEYHYQLFTAKNDT